MKTSLYKSKLTGKIYLVEKANYTKGYVKAISMHFPYGNSTMSIQSLKHYYTPITKEEQ